MLVDVAYRMYMSSDLSYIQKDSEQKSGSDGELSLRQSYKEIQTGYKKNVVKVIILFNNFIMYFIYVRNFYSKLMVICPLSL